MAAKRSSAIEHGTVTLDRAFDASPARVFAAWEDVEARARWGNPSPNTEIVYDQADFRVGGIDVSRCGAVGELNFVVEVRYLDIMPNQRLVFTESVRDAGRLLSHALICVEFEPDQDATLQRFVAQIASFDGASMIEGYAQGWAPAFDNLAAELRR